MRLISPRLSFLAGAGALAFFSIGMPAFAASGGIYAWPLVVEQPMAVKSTAGSFLGATCTVTQNGKKIGTGTTPQTPYAPSISTATAASATIEVTVSPTRQSLIKQPNGFFTDPLLLSGAEVQCTVTIVGATAPPGHSKMKLPKIAASVGPVATPVVPGMKPLPSAPKSSSVTMPNISM
jgi:hypothetical protein